MSITEIENIVTTVTQKRDLDEAKRTDECLTSTCLYRSVFTRRQGREPRLAECPDTCPYHPESKEQKWKRKMQSSPRRTFTYEGQHSEMNRRLGPTTPSRHQVRSRSCADLSPSEEVA